MIDKIILIPKDAKILESDFAGFTPPQAFLDGTSGDINIWRRYDSIKNYPEDKNFHTFGLIFAWDKKPVYAGLDYFYRLYSGNPFEWPLMWSNAERNLKDIVLKINGFGVRPNSFGEVVILNSLHQELSWPTLMAK
jgi:hypothetical protein